MVFALASLWLIFEMNSPTGNFLTKPASTSVGKSITPNICFPQKTKMHFITAYKFLFNKKETKGKNNYPKNMFPSKK